VSPETDESIIAAYIQFQPTIADKDANFRTVETLVGKLPEDVELVVLPELCFTGYNFASKRDLLPLAEYAESGETARFLQKLAAEKNIYIVAGFPELAAGKIYNSAMLASPKGFVGAYRKVHLFDREKLIFEAGEEFKLFELSSLRKNITFKLGILICFDWAFAESWLIMFRKNAEIIAHCANLVLPEKAQRAVPVMAMMHRFAIITANRIGVERRFAVSQNSLSAFADDTLRFTGNSLIADADGKILSQAPADETYIGSATINLKLIRNKQMTANNNLINDRKPRIYLENNILGDKSQLFD